MEIATISRVRCRYWRAYTGRDVGDTFDHLRLCLAVDDSRPMQFIFPNGGSWTFSRWNEQLGISIPADAPAETAPAGP